MVEKITYPEKKLTKKQNKIELFPRYREINNF